MTLVYGRRQYSDLQKKCFNLIDVSFGDLNKTQKWFVEFVENRHEYRPTQFCFKFHKDLTFEDPCQEATFNASDLCGLDWGIYVKRPKTWWIYHKPTRFTYVTVITKNRSISMLFKGDDMGHQMRDWRDELVSRFYGRKMYLRQNLVYLSRNGEEWPVFLHAGRDNITLATPRNKNNPAQVLYKCSWPRNHFEECRIPDETQALLILTVTSAYVAGMRHDVCLRCDAVLQDENGTGNVLTRQETMRKLKQTLDAFVFFSFFVELPQPVYDNFLNENLYDELDSIYAELPDILVDNNVLEHKIPRIIYTQRPPLMDGQDPDHSVLQQHQESSVEAQALPSPQGQPIPSTTHQLTTTHGYPGTSILEAESPSLPVNVVRDIQKSGQMTHAHRQQLTDGWILMQFLHKPPLEDTLGLPTGVRADICVRLYTKDHIQGGNSDWIALADKIGIRYRIVEHIQGILSSQLVNGCGAELLFRYWQFTWSEHQRKKSLAGESHYDYLPCTPDKLMYALEQIGQHKLVQEYGGFASRSKTMLPPIRSADETDSAICIDDT